jgi:hypothetical protein
LEDYGVMGDNIKMGMKVMGWEGVVWIHLAQDRDKRRARLNTVMDRRVSKKARSFFTTCLTISFQRKIAFHGVCPY